MSVSSSLKLVDIDFPWKLSWKPLPTHKSQGWKVVRRHLQEMPPNVSNGAAFQSGKSLGKLDTTASDDIAFAQMPLKFQIRSRQVLAGTLSGGPAGPEPVGGEPPSGAGMQPQEHDCGRAPAREGVCLLIITAMVKTSLGVRTGSWKWIYTRDTANG